VNSFIPRDRKQRERERGLRDLCMAQRSLIITVNLAGEKGQRKPLLMPFLYFTVEASRLTLLLHSLSSGVNAACAAVRLLQLFCRDSTFRGVLASDNRSYDFVPLMNTFDPVARILAMDLYGLLGSVSEFTISEGIAFVCRELKTPSTPGSLMKAIETLHLCSLNRHYIACFQESALDVCKITSPSYHLVNPNVDTVFVVEKCLLILLRLSSVSTFAVRLTDCGALTGLLEIVLEGNSLATQQVVLPVCSRKSQQLDLPTLAHKILLSLSQYEACRSALLSCFAPKVLMQVLDTASQALFAGDASLPSFLTTDKVVSLFSKSLSPTTMLALETLYLLCLGPFEASSLFSSSPSACSLVVAAWGLDALISSGNESKGGLPVKSTSRFASSIVMRCGVNSFRPKLALVSLMYQPDSNYEPALTRMPWRLLVDTYQLWVLFDIIKYDASSSGAIRVPLTAPKKPPRASLPPSTPDLDGGVMAVMDAATVLEAKLIACTALHAIIVASKDASKSSSSPLPVTVNFDALKKGVITLCADHGLLACLEPLALQSIEVAFLLSEIFSWEEVNFRYCSTTFMDTLSGLLNSPSAPLRLIAMKLLFDGVQHSGPSQSKIKSSLSRRAVFTVARECIGSCLQQLRVRSGNNSRSTSPTRGSPTPPPAHTEMNAALSSLPDERVTPLLIESLIVTNCYFENPSSKAVPRPGQYGQPLEVSDLGGIIIPSEEEILTLTVACEGLIEILETSYSDAPSLVLSSVNKSLWTALLNLSRVKECAHVLLGTRLLSFLSLCLANSSAATTTAAEAMDRMSSRRSLDSGLLQGGPFIASAALQILINIVEFFPDLLAEGLLSAGFYALLFSYLKSNVVSREGQDSGENSISTLAVNEKMDFQLMVLLGSSACTSLAVCEHLIAVEGLVLWFLCSVSDHCKFLVMKARTKHSNPFGDAETKLSDVFKREQGDSEGEENESGSEYSRSPRGRDNAASISLEQRMVLLANICRCQSGKTIIFACDEFLSSLAVFVSSHGSCAADVFSVSSDVTFAVMSMMLALAPLYHSPALYPYVRSRRASPVPCLPVSETNSPLAHQLMTTLTIAAGCRDLTVIDKVLLFNTSIGNITFFFVRRPYENHFLPSCRLFRWLCCCLRMTRAGSGSRGAMPCR
jgi:hypothetical protein